MWERRPQSCKACDAALVQTGLGAQTDKAVPHVTQVCLEHQAQDRASEEGLPEEADGGRGVAVARGAQCS